MDFGGHELRVGTLVVYGAPADRYDPEYRAHVVSVSDPETEYREDEYGRDVAQSYFVEVRIRFITPPHETETVRAKYSLERSRDLWTVEGVLGEVFEEGGDLEVVT